MSADRRRALGRGKAGGVPDLPWADLAETQMRREPGRAVPIGPVAVAGIAGDTAFEECLEAGCAAPRRASSLAQSAGPVRPSAQAPQSSLSVIACAGSTRVQGSSAAAAV